MKTIYNVDFHKYINLYITISLIKQYIIKDSICKMGNHEIYQNFNVSLHLLQYLQMFDIHFMILHLAYNIFAHYKLHKEK